MAKITQLPEERIRLGFKGVIDFYERNGVVIAAKWPVTPRSHLTEATKAQWPDFAYVSKAYAEADATIRGPLFHMAQGTQSTARDIFVALAYGKGISLSGLSYPIPPSEAESGANMLQFDLLTSPTNTLQTVVVDSTTFVDIPGCHFNIDFSVTSFTHYAIFVRGLSSQSGETVSMCVAFQATPTTPLSGLPNDLVVTNLQSDFFSGWLPIAGAVSILSALTISMKGSNGTVDLSHRGVRVVFKYDP